MISSKLNTHPIQNSVDFFSELSKIVKNTNTNTNTNTNMNFADNAELSDSSNIVISTSLPPSTSASEYDDICLISKEKLHPNHIMLDCKHKFNYIPIYKEVLYQKIKSNTLYEVTKLQSHQIKCPYCRTITNKLLPYIPYPSIRLAKNIHSSYPDCIHTATCSHITKKADDMLTPCNKYALYFEHENILLCPSHYKQYVSKKEKDSLKNANKVDKANALKSIVKDKDHGCQHKCGAVIKSGANKGKTCNCNIYTNESQFCKRHS